MRRRRALRWRSDRAARAAAELRASKAALLERSGGYCEAHGFSEYCSKVGSHAHHVLTRARGGKNDPSNLLWCCEFCHADIHANPARATAAGLLRSQYEAAS